MISGSRNSMNTFARNRIAGSLELAKLQSYAEIRGKSLPLGFAGRLALYQEMMAAEGLGDD